MAEATTSISINHIWCFFAACGTSLSLNVYSQIITLWKLSINISKESTSIRIKKNYIKKLLPKFWKRQKPAAMAPRTENLNHLFLISAFGDIARFGTHFWWSLHRIYLRDICILSHRRISSYITTLSFLHNSSPSMTSALHQKSKEQIPYICCV